MTSGDGILEPRRTRRGASTQVQRMSGVGFACVWDLDREKTWSHIPHNLLMALQAEADIRELAVRDGAFLTRLRNAQNRRSGQPLWVPRFYNDVVRALTLRASARQSAVASVLQINELARCGRPYWVYRDMTWAQVLAYGGDSATGVIEPALARRRESHERHVYARAAGVFTFSEWAARSVREMCDVPTVVVPPGVNARATCKRDLTRRPRHLLFVGRAFERKGGPATVEAFRLLHASDPSLTLTIAGPGAWPMRGPIPNGVRFLGDIGPKELGSVFETSDLFVLPTHFEAYGIVFVEALAAGLPCVARDVCAVPEIVTADRGRLVYGTSPEELAHAIDDALSDRSLHADVVQRSREIADYFTWRRAATQMLSHIQA